MSELKPCPFCGGEPEMIRSSDGFTSIGCLKCNPLFGAMVQGKNAVELWNTRYEKTITPSENKIYDRTGEYIGSFLVCPDCSHNLSKDDAYCANCGARVINE